MDKKLPTNLDPKLKEVYDRVMGISLPQNNIKQQQQIVPQTPPQAPTVKPPQNQPNITTLNATVPISTTPSSPTTPNVFVAPSVTVPNEAVKGPSSILKPQEKKTSSISPVILIVLAVIFFVVYALFWMKFFNVSLPIPFLSS